MKHFRWQIFLGVGLIVLSAMLYGAHYLIFGDAHHIWIYLVGDIAFVPIEVLMVTLILHELLASRDRKAKMNKLNMVIGTFFSEVGTDLLRFLARHDPGRGPLAEELKVEGNWSGGEFEAAKKVIGSHEFRVKVSRDELAGLGERLAAKRGFLVTLLENPLLLEHDRFTESLWAVFHLAEELESRTDLGAVGDNDLEHLEGDMERTYTNLSLEWVNYMQHLKAEYPYLFSLAMRKNPFSSSEDAAVN